MFSVPQKKMLFFSFGQFICLFEIVLNFLLLSRRIAELCSSFVTISLLPVVTSTGEVLFDCKSAIYCVNLFSQDRGITAASGLC